MKFECIMCMESLESPAPEDSVAISENAQEANVPGSSRRRKNNKKKNQVNSPESLSKICTTGCGHMFHKVCLHRWFNEKKKKECPSCRKILTPSKVIDIYPAVSPEEVTDSTLEAENSVLLARIASLESYIARSNAPGPVPSISTNMNILNASFPSPCTSSLALTETAAASSPNNSENYSARRLSTSNNSRVLNPTVHINILPDGISPRRPSRFSPPPAVVPTAIVAERNDNNSRRTPDSLANNAGSTASDSIDTNNEIPSDISRNIISQTFRTSNTMSSFAMSAPRRFNSFLRALNASDLPGPSTPRNVRRNGPTSNRKGADCKTEIPNSKKTPSATATNINSNVTETSLSNPLRNNFQGNQRPNASNTFPGEVLKQIARKSTARPPRNISGPRVALTQLQSRRITATDWQNPSPISNPKGNMNNNISSNTGVTHSTSIPNVSAASGTNKNSRIPNDSSNTSTSSSGGSITPGEMQLRRRVPRQIAVKSTTPRPRPVLVPRPTSPVETLRPISFVPWYLHYNQEQIMYNAHGPHSSNLVRINLRQSRNYPFGSLFPVVTLALSPSFYSSTTTNSQIDRNPATFSFPGVGHILGSTGTPSYLRNSAPVNAASPSTSEMTSNPRTCTTPTFSSLTPRISEHSPPATGETDANVSSLLINSPTSVLPSLTISNLNVSPIVATQMSRTGTSSVGMEPISTSVDNRESISPFATLETSAARENENNFSLPSSASASSTDRKDTKKTPIPVRQRQIAMKSTSRPPESGQRLLRIIDQLIQQLHDPVNQTRSRLETQEESSATAGTEPNLGNPLFSLPDTFQIAPTPKVENTNDIPTTNISPVVPRINATATPASKKEATSTVRIKETAGKSTSRPPNFFGSSFRTSDSFQSSVATVTERKNTTTAPKKKTAHPSPKKKVAATVTTKETARKSTTRWADYAGPSHQTNNFRSATNTKETARKSTALPPRRGRIPRSSPWVCSSESEDETDESNEYKKKKNGCKRQKRT